MLWQRRLQFRNVQRSVKPPSFIFWRDGRSGFHGARAGSEEARVFLTHLHDVTLYCLLSSTAYLCEPRLILNIPASRCMLTPDAPARATCGLNGKSCFLLLLPKIETCVSYGPRSMKDFSEWKVDFDTTWIDLNVSSPTHLGRSRHRSTEKSLYNVLGVLM